MSLLQKIDSLFLESGLSIKNIEVKIIPGKKVEDQKYPTASFVASGFCIVLLHTECGLTGLGEPSPYGGNLENTLQAAKEINKELKGKPLSSAWMHKNFDKELLSAGYGELAKQAVIASITQCCMDILGKQLELPVYKILNPNSKGKISAYASGGMIYDDQSLDLYVEEAVSCKNKGFNAWKFRPSTPRGLDHFQRNKTPPPIDINALKQTIKSVSNAVGSGFEILLDVGCRCKNISEARDLANFSLDYNIGFIEEPLPRNINLYHELITETDIKISTGEALFSSEQFDIWAENNAIDIFQPDTNLVGMREGIKTFSVAEKHNKKVVLHNWANAVSNFSNIHMATSMRCRYIESSIIYNPFRESLVHSPLLPIGGGFELRDEPGLGCLLNEKMPTK
jgi:L-alanine-DL-glutamate epimerase-like enolase superfamily enzyme